VSGEGNAYRLGFWFYVSLAAFLLLAIAICFVVKGLRKNEATQDSDLIYTNLEDARQIYGRIIK
jgi:hypothetical protein